MHVNRNVYSKLTWMAVLLALALVLNGCGSGQGQQGGPPVPEVASEPEVVPDEEPLPDPLVLPLEAASGFPTLTMSFSLESPTI